MNHAEPTMDDYTPRKAAVIAYRAGLSVLPPTEDGEKIPIVAWKQFQLERPSRETLQRWYPDNDARYGVGLVCGAVSNNLEVLDFDDGDVYQTFRDTAEAIGLGDVIDRIETGYFERTPDNGAHWLYYCEEISGNTELARMPDPDMPKGVSVLIETRGEGGYIVTAPSFGPVHPSGRSYRLMSGGFDSIATITPEERHELFTLARAFDQMPKAEPIGVSSLGTKEREGTRPGDDYNAKMTWAELLEPYGWQRIFTRGETEFWRRPGKDRGISATINYRGSDLLYVFTTSTTFDSERSYDRFGAYAFLEHNADFGAATKALGALGYGEPFNPSRANLIVQEKKRTDGLTAKDFRKLAHTDMGAAQRLALRFGHEMRYCFAWKKWLVWDGRRWQPDATGKVIEFAKETARRIYEEAAVEPDKERQEEITKFAVRTQNDSRLQAMINLARSEPGIPVLTSDLDANPWQFNVLNGTVDLTTGRLMPHRQEDYITKIAPVEYDSDARLALWEEFLDTVTELDNDVQEFLQRAAGYSLTGSTREEKLFFIHGPTNSGKSTFAEALKVVLGDYALTADFDTFLARTFTGGPRPDIARLAGSRFVASIEVDDGKKLAEGLVKMITGGDTVTARKLYQEEFEFKPSFKLWLVANHAPQIADDDEAMWRRIVRVPFDHTIPKAQRDTTIKQRLTDLTIGGPAILAWLVKGCLKWQQNGLSYPQRIIEATEEYRNDMDPIGDFLEELCVTDSTAWTSSKALRQTYEDWGKEEGVTKQLLGGKAFGERLRARGCTPKPAWIQGKQHRGWLGIGLKGADSQHVFKEEV